MAEFKKFGIYRKKYTASLKDSDVSEYMAKRIKTSMNSSNNIAHCERDGFIQHETENANIQNEDVQVENDNFYVRCNFLSDNGEFHPEDEGHNDFNPSLKEIYSDLLFSQVEKEVYQEENEYYLPKDVLDEDQKFYEEKKKKPLNLGDLIKDQTFSNKINTPVSATPLEILFMILKLGTTQKMPITVISKIISLINSIFEKPVLPMESRYLIDKLFNEKDTSVFNVTCPTCGFLAGNINDLSDESFCEKCNKVIDVTDPSSDNLIVVIDPTKTIINLLESNADYYDSIMKRNLNRKGTNRKIIEDIYDGKMYRDFVDALPNEEASNYVTAIINSDGAQPFEKSPRSLWPIYLMINELPVKDRFDSVIPCAIWFNRKKPNFSVFLDLFVELIKKIQENPLQCNIKGEIREIKLFTLVCSVDTVARALMQGSTQFNGRYGCDFCYHPTLLQDIHLINGQYLH